MFKRDTFALTADRRTWEELLRLRTDELIQCEIDGAEPDSMWDDSFWNQLQNKLKRTRG